MGFDIGDRVNTPCGAGTVASVSARQGTNVVLDDGRIYVAYPGSQAVIPLVAQPSDFKVGDVVRAKANPLAVGEVTDVARITSSVRFRGRAETYPYYNCSLELVSRPSEAESGVPKAEVDAMLAKYEAVGRPIRRATAEAYLAATRAQASAPVPTLKVGDRVRIRTGSMAGETGIIERIHPTTMDVVDNAGRTLIAYNDSVEPLPPELASVAVQVSPSVMKEMYPDSIHPGVVIEYDEPHEPALEVLGGWVDSEFEWLTDGTRRRKLPRGKPMTATAASIEPLVSYNIEAEKEILRIFGEAAFGAKPMISGAKPLPNQDGWMPAGTYMPLKEKPSLASRERMLAAKLAERSAERLLFRSTNSDTLFGECLASGIRNNIPQRDRRFSSQTAQWGPYDIWDTLEDA